MVRYKNNPPKINDRPSISPLQTSWRDSRKVDWLWMRDGYKLTPVQRIGFASISLIALVVGVSFLEEALSFLFRKDIQALLWCPASAVFLYLGFRGLLNSMSFRRTHRE